MKKTILVLIIMAVLTGITLADHGISPVPETQGIVTSTTIDAVGNFASTSEIQWRITDDPDGLPGIPPLEIEFASIYESVYTEDTASNGNGLILYDKELDVETSGQISGQWNIEALKELAFVGIDGARVTSSDTIFVDGAATPYLTEDVVICPFASDASFIFPAYCNRAEAGSTIDMTVANVRTTSTDRFVMPSGDHAVELNHDILVTELIDDLPSMGTASAYMEVLVQEGRGVFMIDGIGGGEIGINQIENDPLMERIEFSEETTVTGDITTFEKLMHYESILTGGSGIIET
ncbi:MAG: hypothetical protein LLF84_02370 [Methanoregulaceae archaeon]|jgi:hypothetical protein|nr:hypothetical protein [Methanoregulaceae archaeon]